MAKLPAQPNQSLIDGLACLQALASAGAPIGSRQLARQLDLEATRVNRLLKTLAHLGIAQQTPDRQYVAGPAMHVLAAQAMFGSGLIRRALEPLESLRRFGLSVAMGVLWRDQVSYLYHAAPGASAAESIGRVGLFPATRSSIGMVLLSRLSAESVAALYDQQPLPHFEDVRALQNRLAEVREAGFAVVRPFADGATRTIAVGIENEPAAIAMSGEFDDAASASLAEALQSAAGLISHPTIS